jgi:hypothetical protein
MGHRWAVFISILAVIECSDILSISNLTQCSVGSSCQVVVISDVQLFGNTDTVTFFNPFNNGEIVNITFSNILATYDINSETPYNAIDPLYNPIGGCACALNFGNNPSSNPLQCVTNSIGGDPTWTCNGEKKGSGEYINWFWTQSGEPQCNGFASSDRISCFEYVVTPGEPMEVWQGNTGNFISISLEYNGTTSQLTVGNELSLGQFNISLWSQETPTPDLSQLAVISTKSGCIISYDNSEVVENQETDCSKIGWYNGDPTVITDGNAVNCNYELNPTVHGTECPGPISTQLELASLTSYPTLDHFNFYGIYTSHTPNNEEIIQNPIILTISNNKIVFNSSLPNITVSTPSPTGSINIVCLHYPSVCLCPGTITTNASCSFGSNAAGPILLYSAQLGGNYWGFITSNFEIVQDQVNGLGNIEFNTEPSSIRLIIKSNQLIPEKFISSLIPIVWQATNTNTELILVVSSSSPNQQGECIIELVDETSDSIYLTNQNKTVQLNSTAKEGTIYCLNHATPFSVATPNIVSNPENSETVTAGGGGGTNSEGSLAASVNSMREWVITNIYLMIGFVGFNIVFFVLAKKKLQAPFFTWIIAPILGFPFYQQRQQCI